MQLRKPTALTLTAVTLGLLSVGMTWADDDSPLHQLMEKVQASNAAILKGTRNKVNFTKSQAEVVASAKELVKLGKEARKETGPAKEQKQPQSKWEGLMDDMIKESEAFAKVAEASTTTYDQAKTAYKAVQKTCTNCHDVFRVEE
jgi:cytochrome c556